MIGVKLKSVIAQCLASTLVASVSLQASAGQRTEIKFRSGSTSATVGGSVIRGERDRYLVAARAGQFLKLSIWSIEDNAVFDVLMPGADDKSEQDIKGTVLPGAKEVRIASTQLPNDGRYMIVVGGTRGNASYKLNVSITNEAPLEAHGSISNKVASREILSQVKTVGGILTVEQDRSAKQLRLNGKAVVKSVGGKATPIESYFVEIKRVFRVGSNDVVLVSELCGGSACGIAALMFVTIDPSGNAKASDEMAASEAGDADVIQQGNQLAITTRPNIQGTIETRRWIYSEGNVSRDRALVATPNTTNAKSIPNAESNIHRGLLSQAFHGNKHLVIFHCTTRRRADDDVIYFQKLIFSNDGRIVAEEAPVSGGTAIQLLFSLYYGNYSIDGKVVKVAYFRRTRNTPASAKNYIHAEAQNMIGNPWPRVQLEVGDEPASHEYMYETVQRTESQLHLAPIAYRDSALNKFEPPSSSKTIITQCLQQSSDTEAKRLFDLAVARGKFRQ